MLSSTDAVTAMLALAFAGAAFAVLWRRAAAANARLLEETRERLRQAAILDAAMETVPIGVALIGTDLRYIRVNHAVAAITGVPVDAHPGRHVREVNPLLQPEVEETLRRVATTGEPRLNYRISRPTPHAKGGVLEIAVQYTAFRDHEGAIAGVCAAATDLSEWRALQHQLFQAQKLEAVGQLTAGIAHDFNNLLTIISSCSDLMLMEMGGSSPHRADVEEIRSAAERATTLARRMLGMAGRRAVIPKPVEMHSAIEESRDLLKRATRATVALDVLYEDKLSVVKADPSQIEQILLNLVINAVDAMPDGGRVSVTQRAVTLAAPRLTRSGEVTAGEYVEVSVADTGEGMSPAVLGRVFEPFFTTKAEGKGTGLGLATVFAIVREMRGGIEVLSEPGKGTTFRLLFPRLVEEESTGPRRARAEAYAALPRGSETVLVVEDEDALRGSVSRVFSRQGFTVLQARHGGEALRLLRKRNDVALVVSDLNMPGVDGHELARRLQSVGRPTPMLFMSGSNDADGLEAALPAMVGGRDRFISKPFEIEQLLLTAHEMLSATRPLPDSR